MRYGIVPIPATFAATGETFLVLGAALAAVFGGVVVAEGVDVAVTEVVGATAGRFAKKYQPPMSSAAAKSHSSVLSCI